MTAETYMIHGLLGVNTSAFCVQNWTFYPDSHLIRNRTCVSTFMTENLLLNYLILCFWVDDAVSC